jgi:(3,5-dihydroxyphenyl)acetyl-CoA 1,2-dioxygenase
MEGRRTAPLGEAAAADVLSRAGIDRQSAAAWLSSAPERVSDYARDRVHFSQFWRASTDLLGKLSKKPARDPEQAEAAGLILETSRQARELFLAAHAETVYRALTRDYASFIRVEQLVYDAARLIPGLMPGKDEVTAEACLAQRDKEGLEIDQGLFLSHVLAHPGAGTHLCHAMLLPRSEALERFGQFEKDGALELSGAKIERQGSACLVEMRNSRFLNAEDESTIDDIEIAIDIAILDPRSAIAVLRGGRVDHPKHSARRLFSSGINLTHLYFGKIPYVWYIRRDMGPVNKIYRGLARPEASPDEIGAATREKPWIAAVDGFAIGGGCQYLLVMDYVLAASDAYLSLPARKEGIIPGAANLRLARFVGDRIARQLVMSGRRLKCESPEGRLICDEIAAPDTMDTALARAVASLGDAGVVSAAANRRAFRLSQEPLDLFRRYMALYAREQAFCHFSPALIANLERHWQAQQRKP